MSRAAVVILIASASLAACVSVPPADQAALCLPLEDALSAAPDSVRLRAEQGEAVAQLEYSILLRNGLRGLPVDVPAARKWRYQAVKPRTATRISTVSIYQYGIDIRQRAAIEDCADALAQGLPLSPVRQSRGTCGGESGFAELQAAWRAAKTRG
jgi:TPR repeat protein